MYQVILDSPTLPVSKIQIAKLGSFQDARYGSFSISADDVKDWQRNLANLPGRRALIDLDHSADRSPRSTEAAGWLTSIDLENGVPTATVEWTPLGRKAIEERRYSFFSPTYGTHKTEDGTEHENALLGGALTNRPFLNMPAVTLASAERLQTLDGVEPRSLDAPDQSELVRLLDLPAGADERTILDAVRDLRAASGRQAFDHAFDDALRHLRVTPAERPALERVYALDSALAFELLGSRPPIVASKPYGAPSLDLTHQAADDPARLLEAGIHPEGHELDQQIRQELRERGLPPSDYAKILEQRIGGAR